MFVCTCGRDVCLFVGEMYVCTCERCMFVRVRDVCLYV